MRRPVGRNHDAALGQDHRGAAQPAEQLVGPLQLGGVEPFEDVERSLDMARERVVPEKIEARDPGRVHHRDPPVPVLDERGQPLRLDGGLVKTLDEVGKRLQLGFLRSK